LIKTHVKRLISAGVKKSGNGKAGEKQMGMIGFRGIGGFGDSGSLAIKGFGDWGGENKLSGV